MSIYEKLRSLLAIFLAIALPTLPVLAETEATKPEPVSLYKQIGNEYLTPSEIASANIKEETLEEKLNKLNFFQRIRELMKSPELKLVSDAEQKVMMFNSLQGNNNPNTILPTTAWTDLELYKFSNFVKAIDDTHTAEGEAVLAYMLSQPSKDMNNTSDSELPDLKTRQAIVKKLVDSPRLLERLDKELQQIGQAEAVYLSLYKEEGALNKLAIQSCSAAGESKGTIRQEVGLIYSQFMSITVNLVEGLFIANILHKAGKRNFSGIRRQFMPLKSEFRYGDHEQAVAIAYLSWIGLILAPFYPMMLHSTKKSMIDTPQYIQKKLINAASAINSARTIHTIISRDKDFQKGVLGYAEMETLLTNPKKISNDLNNLLNKLNTNTFKGSPSYFSVTGRVFSTYNTFPEVRSQLTKLFQAIGCIDAYVAMAKLYKKSQGTSTPYCFAEFVEQDTPYLLLTDVWSPLLGKNKAIPNSIEFGGEKPRNMILTGQNTAGKSTVLKSITYSILLAQTFGIAPAQRMVLTPFTIINTYVNVTDDIANGRSLFANEVFRAQGLLERVQGLKPNEFSFTIIDEMFRGTGPEHAEVLSYKYAKKLAEFPNAIVIESTHYPKLIKLEEETKGVYKNYKIDIIKREDGSLFRPYKLEEGYTLTNIAEDILKEAGLILD